MVEFDPDINVVQADHDLLRKTIISFYNATVQATENNHDPPKPLYIWGRSSIGKSEVLKEAAKELAKQYNRKFTEDIRRADSDHFVFIDRRLVRRSPTDMSGVLFKDKQGDMTVAKWIRPYTLYMLSRNREEAEGIKVMGILALEELNLAPSETQSGAYDLILDRRLEELVLAGGIYVVATGNLTEDNAFTFDMPGPLRKRFNHVLLKPPVFKDEENKKGWFYYAVENGVDSRIIAFLSLHPDWLFKPNEDTMASPMPRTWKMASENLKAMPDDPAYAVGLAVGGTAAGMFQQFLQMSQTIDIDTLLRNPYQFHTLDVAQKFAVIGSLAHLFGQQPEKYGYDLLRFATHLLTGIADSHELGELVEEFNSLNEIPAKQRMQKRNQLVQKFINNLNREPEMAATLLNLMKASNREMFARVLENSAYTSILFELIHYVL